MYTLKAEGLEGAGPGLIRVSGSFAIVASAVSATRPSKGNFTVTRKATGVYVIKYQQPCLSVISAGAQLGDNSSVSGSLRTGVPAYTVVSQDFMTTDAGGANWAADSTNTQMVILVFNTSNNALTDVPSNVRLSFDFCFATSTENQ